MKLIDQILDGNSDITSVTKLEKVLELFALMVAERMPVFRGVPVESLQTSMCEDCSAIIFSVDNKPLAAVRVLCIWRGLHQTSRRRHGICAKSPQCLEEIQW